MRGDKDEEGHVTKVPLARFVSQCKVVQQIERFHSVLFVYANHSNVCSIE